MSEWRDGFLAGVQWVQERQAAGQGAWRAAPTEALQASEAMAATTLAGAATGAVWRPHGGQRAACPAAGSARPAANNKHGPPGHLTTGEADAWRAGYAAAVAERDQPQPKQRVPKWNPMDDGQPEGRG